MIETLVILGIFGVLYAYIGYPCVLLVCKKLGHVRKISEQSTQSPKSLCLIIAARNEERVIRDKLENSLLMLEVLRQSSSIPVEIVVASDCSDDRTDEIVREFADRGVKLSRPSVRGGKETAQQNALRETTGEIIVFTDSKVSLEKDALVNFLRYFSDFSIGAVSSIDKVVGVSGEKGSGEGMYVRYEMWLRRLETEFDTVIGLSGSCFGVRRELCEPWRVDLPSDFAMLINTRRAGLRGVLAEDIVCTYRTVKSEKEEFQRKVRTVLRGITTLFACGEVLNVFRFGSFAWQMISHKLFRWLVPWFVLLVVFGSFWLSLSSRVYAGIALLSAIFFTLAYAGWKNPVLHRHLLVKIPLFFTVTNLGIAVAWIKFLSGKRAVTWNPSEKHVSR